MDTHMPFWKHTYHIVWATKNRQPWILPDYEDRLYAFLKSKAGELDCYLHAVNGTLDHTHVVASIPPKHSVAWFTKTLKGASAYFINTAVRSSAFHFAWQRGYGSLTIGERQREAAIAYVNLQKQHHLHNTINVWLERCEDQQDDDDDNSEDTGSGQSGSPLYGERGRVMKEDSVEYELWDDSID
jgi:putative transposase